MLEFAYYSVISPEGCASILYRDVKKASLAADALQLRAVDLKRRDLIDDIIEEPVGGAHRDPENAAKFLKTYLVETLGELVRLPAEVLLKERWERIRCLGEEFGLG